ncbi:hypothetical protein ACQ4PT_021383 [Festuca glaucescens]
MEDHHAPGVPEPRGGLRGPQHLPALRLQEHLRRGHPALGHQRGDLRRPLLRLLDAHTHPPHQVRLHCPPGRRQWRGRHFRPVLSDLPPCQCEPPAQPADCGRGALHLQAGTQP